MIRRAFWLLLGATVGVSGYRRASRLARSVVPGHKVVPGSAAAARWPAGRRTLTGRRALHYAARAGRSAADGAAFARDVRDGMTEYLDRQAREPGRTLGSLEGAPAAESQRRPTAP